MVDRMQPQSITTSTYTVKDTNNQGAIVILNRAAGIAVTLPAASGSGSKFSFIVGTTVTSNTTTIKVASSSDIMTGVAMNTADGGDTVVGFETAADSDTVTLNGTTTGGIKGDSIILEDISSGLWAVNVVGSASGTEATPFSATV